MNTTPTERQAHFLLVEDDDDHAELIIRNLDRQNGHHTYDRVSDGAEALQFLRKAGSFAAARRPDVIILDLKLPKVDGHDVLAQIKDDPDLRRIPVIVLTTSDADADRAKAYDRHVNSYLVKPFAFEQLRTLVEELAHYWTGPNCPAPE